MMEYNELGKTGLIVSEIAYGALPVGPAQANFSVDKGAAVIRYALEQGINFIDTAQSYKTYPYIAKALEGWTKPVVINSKCAGSSYKDMEAALAEAKKMLGRVPDIFTLHAARAGVEVFEARAGALQCLVDAKRQGIIKAIGLSTHSVAVLNKAADLPEIDVLHPLLNMRGMGIQDGTAAEMKAGVEAAVAKGKGVYLMKIMAGGHLTQEYQQAIKYAQQVKGISSMAIGMLSEDEINANIAAITGTQIAPDILAKLGQMKKRLIVLSMGCIGCGACEKVCPNFAIKVQENKLAAVDSSKCILCGYCVPKCPRFALRLVINEPAG